MVVVPAVAILIGATRIRRRVMPAIVRPAGPAGAVRAFHPVIGDKDPAERIAHALEHIAVVLAGLDHNVEVIANSIKSRTL
jgi:hypothetical protein